MDIDKSNVTAVILAGGKGRRLEGQDKGLVTYKNKRLIEHVIYRIKPQVNEIIINANRNQEIYESYGFPVITDEMSNYQGPLAGFATAMKTVNTDYIITMPCDGPSLPKNLVANMLASLRECSHTDCIFVAHDGERIQPVHALIPVSLIESLEDFLANGDRKIDLWYAKYGLVEVDFSDQPEAFFNVNRKEHLNS